MTPTRTEDLVEIQQLLAKYAVTITQGDVDGLVEVFTPDGTYSAFGDTYTLNRFPVLVDADDALGGPLGLDGREENNLRVGRDGAVDNRRVNQPGHKATGLATHQLEHASVPVACLEVSGLDDLEGREGFPFNGR